MPTTNDQRKQTVAWIVSGGEGYGIERCIVTLALSLERLGWSAPIISLSDGSLADACERAGLRVTRMGKPVPPVFAGSMLSKGRELLSAWRYRQQVVPELRAALRSAGATVVHVVTPNLVALAGKAASDLALPCFWEMPNLVGDRYPFGLNRRIYHLICRRYGIQPLANSRYTAATLGQWLVTPIVFHPLTDGELFNPQTVSPVSRDELGIPADAVTLAIVGRVLADKGHEFVLRALARLKSHRPPLHLLVIGGTDRDPAFVQSLRDIAQAEDVSDRLHFVGAVSDPQRYYGTIDIPINNRVTAEPFGLSVIEAMSMARPVLVHALGGPAETVVDGVTGWHAGSYTTEAMTAALERALRDRPNWPAMGAAARAHALQEFGTTNQARRYMSLVQDRLGQRP